MTAGGFRMRPSRGRAHHGSMDLIAIVLAIATFAVLALLIEGIERV
jgi:hypothetical protein